MAIKKINQEDPKKKKTEKGGVKYAAQNPKASAFQNDVKALENLNKAIDTKRDRIDYDAKSGSQTKRVFSIKEDAKADSVITAGRGRLDKSKYFVKQGDKYIQKKK